MPPKVTKEKERRRIGRPPAGARAGEKVKDYPQLSIRLPAEVKAKLHALSLISLRPQWRLITDAIDCYLKTRPEAEQKIVRGLVRRTRGGTSGGAGAAHLKRQQAPARAPSRRGDR
jgi:predicted transcriptional regulator